MYENIHIKRKSNAEGEALSLRENNGVPFLTINRFLDESWINHGFSTMLGGAGTGENGSMDLSFNRGEDSWIVRENYRRLADAIGFDTDDVVCSHQTHTTTVRVVTEADRGSGLAKERSYHDTDGLITNIPGIVLCTYYADCVPLFFLDPVHKAIGLSHSGWRGTVNRMGANTLLAMQQAYGTDPTQVIAAIGPSICRDCYEVDEDVANDFRWEFICDDVIFHNNRGKYQLDLWSANRHVLLDEGVRPENIITTDICTKCNSHLLYSQRAQGDKRGNMGAFLTIRK